MNNGSQRARARYAVFAKILPARSRICFSLLFSVYFFSPVRRFLPRRPRSAQVATARTMFLCFICTTKRCHGAKD